MKNLFKKTTFKAFLIVTAILSILVFDAADAQRRGGGSFGGRRGGGGFGGSRPSYRSSPSYRTTPRPSPSYSRQSPTTTTSRPRTSFGGSRMSSPQTYTQRYGTPRRTETMSRPNAQGQSQNYVINRYGGMGDGFMTGYMMGQIPFMWRTPFHPAYYYSQPSYYTRPDGTTEVYPPTFSWGKFLFTMVIIAGIIYVLYMILRSRKRAQMSSMSRSSFS